MYYPQSEALLAEKLEFASEEAIDKIDSFLAELNSNQAKQISPWRVSNKTGVSKEAIVEVFLRLSKTGLLKIKYEVWHPDTRVKVFETFDPEELKVPVSPGHEGGDFFIPDDEDIQLSFVLTDVKAVESAKKKVFRYNWIDQSTANSASNHPC